jgi:3-dehydroquinate dehydratase
MNIMVPKLVVTLPRDAEPLAFAREAEEIGADLLEIRDDLTPEVDIRQLAEVLPILAARRTEQPLTDSWIEYADIIDEDISLPPQDIDVPNVMLSMHADRPLDVEPSIQLWRTVTRKGEAIKHVEPFEPDCETRLMRLQQALHGFVSHVTVLAMGHGAEEVRRKLSYGNYLQYCALDEKSASAPGQPLLIDEVRRLKRREGNSR